MADTVNQECKVCQEDKDCIQGVCASCDAKEYWCECGNQVSEPLMSCRDCRLAEDYSVNCVDFAKTTIGELLDALDKVAFKYAKKVAEENALDMDHHVKFVSADITYAGADYFTIEFRFREFVDLLILSELIEEMYARFGAWGHFSKHDKPGVIEFNISVE